MVDQLEQLKTAISKTLEATDLPSRGRLKEVLGDVQQKPVVAVVCYLLSSAAVV